MALFPLSFLFAALRDPRYKLFLVEITSIQIINKMQE
jgi:hypothetical protein